MFLWLIPVLLLGSVFSFFMIKYIVYEETDEHLTYEMQRLLEYHAEHNDLPEYHKVADIYEDMRTESPAFKDTLILEPRDNEMMPYRELHFSILHKGRDFTLVLRQILPGNDDILEGNLLMMLGLFILISVFILLMVNSISGKLWSPFYKTLHTLAGYKITKPVPHFSKSNIDEFNSLNETIEELLYKISDDYLRTKEFNENASHELQTHLAIIRLHVEKLLDSPLNDESSLVHLQTLINASTNLSMAQKSLLLLSKIGNLEYNNAIHLNLKTIVQKSIELFREAMELRNISLSADLADCELLMDEGLAEILINNLIKNAVKHNLQNGHISIHLTSNNLCIENSGLEFSGNPAQLFERFTKGKTGNLGLGLAIVHQICEVYHYTISYAIEENLHKMHISFAK